MAHRCDAEAIKAAGLDLSRDELEDIRKEVNKLLRIDRARMSDAEVMEAVAKAADEREADAIRSKAREARNFEAKAALQQFAVSVMGTRKSRPWIGFIARISPVHGVEAGLRDSIYTTYNAMRGKYFDELFRSKLLREDPALFKLFASGEAESDIATALYRLNRGEALDGVNPAAAKIAEAMHTSELAQLADLNRRGVYVTRADNYAGHTSYDWVKLRSVDPKVFAEKMRERFDLARPVEDPAEELAIYTALHKKVLSSIFDVPEANLGRTSRIKSAEAQRNFVPKSPQAWLDHVAEFGAGSLRDTWLAKMERRARLVAIVDKLGPSYEANLESAFNSFVHQNIADPLVQRRALDEGWPDVRLWLKYATGEINRPVSETLAMAGQVWRTQQRLSTLGMAALSQPPDIAFAAAELKFQGHNGKGPVERGLLSNAGDIVGGMFQGLGSEDRKLMGSLMGVWSDTLIHLLHEEPRAGGAVAGAMDRLQNLFFKINGMDWWANASRLALSSTMAVNHAAWAGRAFDALPEGTRTIFANHGITPAMWDAIRQAKTKIGDHELITSEAIRALPDEAFAGIADATGHNINFTRDDVADRYIQAVLDRVNVGSNQPSWATRKFWIGDAQAGTFWGEFFHRNIAVLKGFPTALVQNTLGRMAYGYGAESWTRGVLTGQFGKTFAETLILSTVLGYLSMTARDLVTGKTPGDPLDPRIITMSMARGGALGIYGDYILGNLQKQYGRNVLTDTLGPGAGQVSDALDLIARWTKIYNRPSDEANAAATVRFATRNLAGPLANLPLTKTAFDYLIYHEVMESLSPGYMARAQRNLEKNTGQHFWMLPGR